MLEAGALEVGAAVVGMTDAALVALGDGFESELLLQAVAITASEATSAIESRPDEAAGCPLTMILPPSVCRTFVTQRGPVPGT